MGFIGMHGPKGNVLLAVLLTRYRFPHMGFIGMRGPKGNDLLAVLLTRYRFYLILSIMVINSIWFLTVTLIWVCFKEEATFSSLSKRKSTKALHKLCFR